LFFGKHSLQYTGPPSFGSKGTSEAFPQSEQVHGYIFLSSDIIYRNFDSIRTNVLRFKVQNFQKRGLSPAISSITSNDGVMQIKVKGTAYFKILGLTIPVLFESKEQISIKDEIENKINL